MNFPSATEDGLGAGQNGFGAALKRIEDTSLKLASGLCVYGEGSKAGMSICRFAGDEHRPIFLQKPALFMMVEYKDGKAIKLTFAPTTEQLPAAAKP